MNCDETESSMMTVEYTPSGTDYRRFVLYHYRLFTGYVSAAMCGASRRVHAMTIYNEWRRPYREALEAARRRFEEEPMPAPIEAGHHWEPSICVVAAVMVFGDWYLAGLVQIREAGPTVDSEFGWILATPDALLSRGGTIRLAIESKFKCFKMPDRPETEHLFQVCHIFFIALH